MKLDIAINYICYLVVFVVRTLKQALKECKTFDFSVGFAGISLDYGLNRISSRSILC